MDVRQLRQFIAVAEALNFRRAAERLGMAQPALSQSIKRLEEELGVDLLIRNRKAVRLSSAGEAFLVESRRTVAQIERAATIARRAGSGRAGCLRIAFISPAAHFPIAGAVRVFHAQFPHVDLELTESTSGEIVKLLENGQVDIGVLRPVVGSNKTLVTESIEKDRFVVALPARHQLAKLASLKLSQLADYPFIFFSATTNQPLHQQTLMLCRQASFSPRIAQEVRRVTSAISLVSAFAGIAKKLGMRSGVPHNARSAE